jgi:mannose-6-phosphate isomerase-like protein (cupin superfamily)
LNIKAYIESGILEQYVIGTLSEAERIEVQVCLATYEQLRKELERIETTLENYAFKNAVSPPSRLKERFLESIANLELEKQMKLSDLPLINKYSDYKNWLKLIENFGNLPLGEDGRHISMLRQDDKVTQMLIVSTTDIEQETHLMEHESFLILEGECKCTIGDQTRLMCAGDFMQIPLFEPHDVQLKSAKVTAILQLVKV